MTQSGPTTSQDNTLLARLNSHLSWRHFSSCSTRWQHLRHRQSNLIPADRYCMDDSPDTSSVLLLPDQNGSEALHVRRHPNGLLFGNLIGTSTRPDSVWCSSTRRGKPTSPTTMSSVKHRFFTLKSGTFPAEMGHRTIYICTDKDSVAAPLSPLPRLWLAATAAREITTAVKRPDSTHPRRPRWC